jgi:hypothetical protein
MPFSATGDKAPAGGRKMAERSESHGVGTEGIVAEPERPTWIYCDWCGSTMDGPGLCDHCGNKVGVPPAKGVLWVGILVLVGRLLYGFRPTVAMAGALAAAALSVPVFRLWYRPGRRPMSGSGRQTWKTDFLLVFFAIETGFA